MTPATAGKIIQENVLRAYLKCSEYYSFGGVYPETPQLQLIRSAFEHLTVMSLRKVNFQPHEEIHSAITNSVAKIVKDSTCLPQELNKLMRTGTINLDSLVNTFSANKYITVYGPFKPRFKISKTPIELSFSAILKSKSNKHLHGITFTPLIKDHHIENDPITILKLKVLEPLVESARYKESTQVVLHNFFINSKQELECSSIGSVSISPDRVEAIERIVQMIEMNYHYPIVPCNYSCEYKDICNPYKRKK